ncbi:MAG: glycogen/starch/alpha-glucan family phosphorylase [Lachnospiraceae bacterium]|nr:glycogen/starch/alpha-glucan family phosphorylase [Lachnospiraceae bacterium]
MRLEESITREILEQRMEPEMEALTQRLFGKSVREASDREVYIVLLYLVKGLMDATVPNDGDKKIYYISAEFLIGKLLSNNLINLGVYEKVERILEKNGKTLAAIEAAEPEPSLGNGGLGRLAACFLDSIATLGLPGEGIGLNYHYGLFKQVFADNKQTAQKDSWLEADSWLTKTDIGFTVCFGDCKVRSRLYDIEVVGYQNGVNKLRLFDAEGVDESLVTEGICFYKEDIRHNLTLFLYPDDSDEKGRLLRIYQQYFMCSNAAQLILYELKEKQHDLRRMYEHAVIQINDTHPSMIIPELIRILVHDKAFPMEEAIDVVTKTCAYTNHTILTEALEKWPLEQLEKAVPQLGPIIRELDARVKAKYESPDVHIIDEQNRVHMAHMDIHYGFSVNGVAAIHTQILKESELKAFYEIYPEKFHNKTNGITFRRWLLSCNRELQAWLNDTIGKEYQLDADKLEKLLAYADDPKAQEAVAAIKQTKKKQLAEYIKLHEGIELDPDSVFDIQIKRMHEYKRQQMNALYIIHKYLEIRAGNKPVRPISIIFGAKAAPAYVIAQDVIHLILVLSKIINADPQVSPYLKVVMVENYNVTYAEKLIPACDISEQISLASKEASGTGNMKFMLNGAVTLGTDDGANVEIHELVGDENIYIFGENSSQVIAHYEKGDYSSGKLYESSPLIKRAVDFIVSPQMTAAGDKTNLERLYHELISKDWFMTLLDLEDYIRTKERMLADYEDQEKWRRMMLVNIAKAGYFSSDRTIAEYNRDIWKL